jgi:hypothetical protein
MVVSEPLGEKAVDDLESLLTAEAEGTGLAAGDVTAEEGVEALDEVLAGLALSLAAAVLAGEVKAPWPVWAGILVAEVRGDWAGIVVPEVFGDWAGKDVPDVLAE